MFRSINGATTGAQWEAFWEYSESRGWSVLWKCPLAGWSSSFSTVHPLDVLLVMRLKLLAFELEGVRHQSCLGSPWIRAQTDLARDLEALQLGCKRRRRQEEWTNWIPNNSDMRQNLLIELWVQLLFELVSPARAASVTVFRTSSSMALLLHSSSIEPRIPNWSARARKCFWLGTTKPIMYVSWLESEKRRHEGCLLIWNHCEMWKGDGSQMFTTCREHELLTQWHISLLKVSFYIHFRTKVKQLSTINHQKKTLYNSIKQHIWPPVYSSLQKCLLLAP